MVLEVLKDGRERKGIRDIPLPDGGISLVEISSAALLSVSIINVLRSHALPKTDFHQPEQVLFALNSTFPDERHNDMFFTIWYGVCSISSIQLIYASGGHPPALLFSDFSLENAQVEQLRTPNFIIGGDPDTIYQSSVQEIRIPARLFVFSDGVFDIIKSDGSIWGFNEFLEFMAQPFNTDQSTLDNLLSYAQEISQKITFENDFSILEIVFH